jgi:hypothetical protein
VPVPNDPDEVRRMLDDVDGGMRRAHRHLGTGRPPGHDDATDLRTGEVDAAAVLAFVEELQAGIAAAEATVARHPPTRTAPDRTAPDRTAPDRTAHEEGQP